MVRLLLNEGRTMRTILCGIVACLFLGICIGMGCWNSVTGLYKIRYDEEGMSAGAVVYAALAALVITAFFSGERPNRVTCICLFCFCYLPLLLLVVVITYREPDHPG